MKLAKIALLPFAIIFATASTAFAGAGCCPAMSGAKAETTKVVQASYKQDSFPDISLAELKQHIKNGSVVLIDVNGSSSYAKGHIPGAVNFAEMGNEGLASALPADKNALIVAYCGGPRCSAYKRAAKVAVALGYTNVQHFSGGISGWKDAGLDVNKG